MNSHDTLAKIKTCDINAACDVITTRDSSGLVLGAIVGCCHPNVGCNFFGDCIASAEYFSSYTTCVSDHSCSQHTPNTVVW
jgi:hypothetical protein